MQSTGLRNFNAPICLITKGLCDAKGRFAFFIADFDKWSEPRTKKK